MGFSVIISLKANSELDKLPKETQERIKDKLRIAKENPRRYLERLKGRLDYKLGWEIIG